MENSLFTYIWKYSKRDQFILLVVTLLTFPLLFITLELPKRIINDAIGASGEQVTVMGQTLTQTQFLMVLCFGFLIAITVHGLLKMRLNTMKGVLAERLLRRFRFQLLSRMLRFPKPYFRKTSQGELVSMVTSEAEPMGGLMGDALSQPVFQAGQMATILVFLFAQSIWFGLASVALIPLQAWLIPKLQRQINLLNKSRIQEVRKLAADIGESAAGVSDLRVNGGMRHRQAVFSDRLGRLFGIRFDIYQKKFFMKFINNFINQLTPFFFYSVGGYLAIKGQISVGALVAALAAYKDLSSPWKELLTYYNQVQDMSLRWQIVTERFAPTTLVDESLYDGEPEFLSRLNGDIVFKNVTVKDEDGHDVLEDINLTIPSGSRVAVKTSSATAASAFSNLLTREVVPTRGSVTIGGQNINEIHQSILSHRIGYAHSQPYLFEGTLGDNLLMPFRRAPINETSPSLDAVTWLSEARRSGNSTDPLAAEWVDPSIAGLETSQNIREWWFELVQAMGIDDFMVRRTLRSVLQPGSQPDLEQRIIELRPEIQQRLNDAGLLDVVHRFDPDLFNPVSPLGSNLLHALPARRLEQKTLAREVNFMRALHDEGIAGDILELSAGVIERLNATFGMDGTDHPLFRMLNLDEDLYHKLVNLAQKRRDIGETNMESEEVGLLMTVPFAFSAEQIGPAFNESFKERVLQVRKSSSEYILAELGDLFERIEPDRYIPVMSVLGNAIYGRISGMAGAKDKQVEDIVVDVISEHGWRMQMAQAIYDLETGLGGDNLPVVFRERVAFSRAGIKKPDILVLENALASHDADSRSKTREKLRELLPSTTKVFVESHFNVPETYDVFVEIVDGRIDGEQRDDTVDDALKSDLNRKLSSVAKAELFANLDRKNQRLLAFTSTWYKAEKGKVIFHAGEMPDAAYLCVKGRAALFFPDREFRNEPITEILPGRLIGDLAVILNKERVLDLVALEDCVFLRLGQTELNAVIENDPAVAVSLLKSVSGHLSNAGDALRYAGSEYFKATGKPLEFD